MQQPTPVLAPYDPAWPHVAARHALRLALLGPVVANIHHIGSTSTPGMLAQPIVDLMPVVASLADLDAERERIEEAGYQWHGEAGVAGRRYCTFDNAGVREAQLHFFEARSPHVERRLAFRDYLRAHPEAARAYERDRKSVV